MPVAPASWQLDFPTLPDSLFSATKSRLLMRPMSSNFRGTRTSPSFPFPIRRLAH